MTTALQGSTQKTYLIGAACAAAGLFLGLATSPFHDSAPPPGKLDAPAPSADQSGEKAKKVGDLLKKRADGLDLTNQEGEEFTTEIRRWLKSDPLACLNYLSQSRAFGVLGPEEIVRLVESSQAGTSGLFVAATHCTDSTVAEALFRRNFHLTLATSSDSALSGLQTYPKHLRRSLEADALNSIVAAQGVEGLDAATTKFKFVQMNLYQGFISAGEKQPNEVIALLQRSREKIDASAGRVGTSGDIIAGMIAMGKLDPDAAIQYAQTLEKSTYSRDLLRSAVTVKLQRDPAHAREILALLGEGNLAPDALKYAASALAKTQPAIAQQLIEEIPSDRLRAEAYTNAGQFMILSNPTGALELASSAANPLTRLQGVASLAEKWFSVDPAKAVEYSATRAEDPAYRNFLSDVLTRNLNLQDPLGSARRLAYLRQLTPSAKEGLQTLSKTLSPEKAAMLSPMLQ